MIKDTSNENYSQNRFTAYLVSAVKNKRITYMEKRKKIRNSEYCDTEVLFKGHSDFDKEYNQYIYEALIPDCEKKLDIQKIMKTMDERNLVEEILKLKKRDLEILMARVFGEQDFTEIGKAHELTGKQAERAYYYILRKLRKELKGESYE